MECRRICILLSCFSTMFPFKPDANKYGQKNFMEIIMTEPTPVKNRFDNSQIRIAYEDLDKSLNNLKGCCGGFGFFSLPAFEALFHPSSTRESVALIAATAVTVLGFQSAIKIMNRVSEIVAPLGDEGKGIKKTTLMQLSKVGFTHALGSAATWDSLAVIGSSLYYGLYKGEGSVGYVGSICAAAVAVTGVTTYAALRSERKLRTTLSELPPPK